MHSCWLIEFVGATNSTSFDELESVVSELVDQVQTGALGESLNISVQTLAVTNPVPEPVDPTGGVRATNETGRCYDSDMSGSIFVVEKVRASEVDRRSLAL